jgi:hypothetical protein
MRRQRIIVSAVLLASFLALVFSRFSLNRYHSAIQSQIEQQLGRKVSLGDMTLGLLPPRLYVKNPVIWDDPAFGAQSPFIKADSMFLSIRLLPLFKYRLAADGVDWQRPQVELIKGGRGEWNIASLGLQRLANLRLHDGRVAITNLQERAKRQIYDHVDLTVGNYVRGQPFSVDAAAYVASSDQNIRLQGKGGPLSEENVLRTPFDGTLSLNRFPIESLNNFVDASARTHVRGVASGTTLIKNQNGKVSASGSVKMEDLNVENVALGYPIVARFTVAEDPAKGVIEIPSATVDLGKTPVSVAGSINLKTSPAELSLNVRSDKSSVAEVTRLAEALGAGVPSNTAVNGEMSVNVQVQGSVRAPVLNGTLSGKELRITSKEMPQPVQVGQIDLRITPAEIVSNPFEIQSGHTKAVTRFVLTRYMSASPAIDFALQSSNAELADVRSIGKALGTKGLSRIDGSGTLNLDLYARGTLHTLRSSEIVKLLGGKASLNITNVHITGTDFSKGLFPKSGQPVHIEGVTGNFLLDRGVARTNDLRVTLNIANVAAAGTVNLGNETLNLRATAILTEAASKQAEGRGPAGIIAGLGANNRGELTVPGIITGTFDHPQFHPDKEQVALSQMKGIVPTLENPAGLLGSILGHGAGTKQSGQQATRRLKPAAHPPTKKAQ